MVKQVKDLEYFEDVPVQYRQGWADFMGMKLIVDPRVFIPRPETELLVSIATSFCAKKGWQEVFILDLCAGSGAVSVSMARNVPGGRVIGLDISEEALKIAALNIDLFGVSETVELLLSDMFSGLDHKEKGLFDCILSNPPYVSLGDYDRVDEWVKSEPKNALYAGEEGMDYLKEIAERSRDFLKPGGFAAVEVGYDQSDKVKKAFSRGGLRDIASFRDFGGHERVVVGWKNG